ncbi:MAG: virulence RhuM family protein [Fibrobacter sp.]|nr:virulence RhuM family protein [Fibrobacter sp.]
MKEILLYKTDNAEVKVEILLQNENLWLTQAKMAELFDVQKAAISKHLKNIFADGELNEKVVVSKMETTTPHGAMVGKEQTKFVNIYNLDAIIAVGYRINSKKATMFRIWATQVLKEYIIKGFAMNDERLKDPQNFFGKDYFEEQLERIREIRASERRFYQKITDIYARCSADYSPDSQITQDFFATVQNKMHYAVTHQTAAKIIYSRADSKKVNMGLADTLNRIVTMYLDFAELQAKRGQVMYMKDWVEKLNAFLQFNERDILEDKGKVTHEIAKAFAEGEYDKFRVIRDANYKSDFDKLMESIAEYKT